MTEPVSALLRGLCGPRYGSALCNHSDPLTAGPVRMTTKTIRILSFLGKATGLDERIGFGGD
jgi:hypothetical protein